MPPEEGRRGNEEGDPALTRDDPTRRCEEDPIDDTELRSARRPLQHAKLMADDEDLEVLASVVSALLATADEETDEGADDEVEEGQHRPIVPGLSERESGFPTPTGRGLSRRSYPDGELDPLRRPPRRGQVRWMEEGPWRSACRRRHPPGARYAKRTRPPEVRGRRGSVFGAGRPGGGRSSRRRWKLRGEPRTARIYHRSPEMGDAGATP
jgi:hypothetical protein